MIDIITAPGNGALPKVLTLRRLFGWSLVYVLIAAAALGANPFAGQTVGPFDLLASYPGWNPDGETVVVRHPERSDILDAVLPMWLDSREQIRDGHVPLWNPLRAGGTAGLFDPTNSMLTVPFMIFVATPDPAMGFYLAILACLVVAGLGMHCLVGRRHGHWVGLFAGISFMLCGFIAGWLFWAHTFTAMWIPWLLLAVDTYVERARFTALGGIAVATALMFLGGFPFVVALGLGAALVYVVCKSIELQVAGTIPNIFGVVFGILFGLALVAVPMFTLMDTISSADLSYRSYGSPLSLKQHSRLLLMPWAQQSPHVESSMYVGMLALPMALIGIAVVGWRPAKAEAMAWSGALFTLVGAVLTFGLLPAEIGRHLPVLSNNPWNRAALLLDMGIILLATTGLAWACERIRVKWASAAILALLCLIQLLDLSVQFRRFNGPTSADFFFRTAPELDALRSRIGPFQYVGQDSRSFMVSGTLGAVGLAEWYAHSFRSAPMKELLLTMAIAPFTTPTATQIGLDGYRWSDPMLDATGLCYAVSADMHKRWPELAKAPGQDRAPLPPVNNILVRQPIEIAVTASVPAIAIRLATYAESDLDGSVMLRLVRDGVDATQSGWLTIPAEEVRDNGYAVFVFAKPLAVQPGNYEIQITYEPGRAQKQLTVWRMVDAPGQLHHGNQPLPGAIEYIISMLAEKEGDLNVVLAGKRMLVAENPGCAKGPYFVEKSSVINPEKWIGRVKLVSYQPQDFKMTVDAPSRGYVVMPMRYMNGWSATVNGLPAPIKLVAGVMPAVSLAPGSSSVTMSYRPPRLFLGLGISFAALLVLAGAGWRRACHPKRHA